MAARHNFVDAVEDIVAPAKGAVTTAIYGEPPRPPSSPNVVARPVSIFDIYPDMTQPRRTIPDVLRSSWNGLPASLPALLDQWLCWGGALSAENAYEANRVLVRGESDIEYEIDAKFFPVQASLISLVQLAADIYRDGLTNPITVAPAGLGHRLETGERRWLAYHLMYLLFGDARWEKVPARSMERLDRYRQAGENTQRANLNMVARARQWALLMMDAWERQGCQFHAYEESGSDRAYYAQVIDMDAPDGTGQSIMNACGVTSRAMLSHYRTVLRLSDENWTQADDRNFSFNDIRGLLNAFNKPKERPTPLDSLATAEREIERTEKRYVKLGQGERRQIADMYRAMADRIERGVK